MADIKEVNGVFGGVEIGNINDQETTTNYAGGVEGIGAIIYKVLELIYQQNKDFGQNSKLFGYNL